MFRLLIFLTGCWLLASPALAAGPTAPQELKDLYFGEALYSAFQGDWFEAIARLDTELAQHHGLDQPELDSLFPYIGLAEFDVGDFELAYRMHRRAGRAINAVINGKVAAKVRNAALFRLARIYFRKNQPVNALQALERISGPVPAALRDDLKSLQAQVLMTNGRFEDAVTILRGLQEVKSLAGFAGYNLGIALLGAGEEQEGRRSLALNGQLRSTDRLALAIRDKSNLVLGDKLLSEGNFAAAKEVLDRVRLDGAFSNQALLGSGWADAAAEHFERALVPWSLLAEREVTDAAVQEALLAVPYAYGKLGVYSKAALSYESALLAFGTEIDKLGASIRSIREGKFLSALVREDLKQDANWVVKLRELPDAPETYYLLGLMASHDFQESLKNYLDLEQLRAKLERWSGDLDAYTELIEQRRSYFEPLLPEVDKRFRLLDSQMRLRLEQRDRIEQRLKALLVAPRPEYLATAAERIARQRILLLEQAPKSGGAEISAADAARIRRLNGVLDWNLQTDYDRRLTEAHQNLSDLNLTIDRLQSRYQVYVRIRQAATQSYQGYTEPIRRQRIRIQAAKERIETLLARQGHQLEVMAVDELSLRRARLEEYQVKVRFAMADSFDRAAQAPGLKGGAP